jgi:peptidylprolyl isomerase
LNSVVRGDRVQVLCGIRLDDGTWIDDDAEWQGPVWLDAGRVGKLALVGDAVIGMKVGDKKVLTIPPEHAYGHRVPARSFQVKLARLSHPIAPGATFPYATRDFSGDVVVSKVEGDLATLDGNHPLAGRSLIVALEVLTIGRCAAST